MIYYPNSERTVELIKNHVKLPFDNHAETESWKYYVLNKTKPHRRITILDQGRVDFTKVYQEQDSNISLSTKDLVNLYRYYYFQLHYTSSLYIYKLGHHKLNPHISNNDTIFIDFGCGPYTAGIAFKEYCIDNAIKPNLEYYGYDISNAMKKSALKISAFSNQIHFPTKNTFDLDYHNLSKLKYKQSKFIILNICYFLAARSFNINNFLDILKTFIDKHTKNKIFIIYQNPSYLNENWKKLKQSLSNFSTLRKSKRLLYFEFDDLAGSWLPNYPKPQMDVYFDFLTNKIIK